MPTSETHLLRSKSSADDRPMNYEDCIVYDDEDHIVAVCGARWWRVNYCLGQVLSHIQKLQLIILKTWATQSKTTVVKLQIESILVITI